MNIGLLGFGFVGQGFQQLVSEKYWLGLHVRQIGVKDPAKPRPALGIPFSTDPNVLLAEDSLDILVEAIPALDEAYQFVKAALQRGKHVVSANKRMLAHHLPELSALARGNGVQLRYEAAVGGAIPVLTALGGYFQTEVVTEIRAIVNGTSNYVLTKMADEGLAYADVVKAAQALGFAEADPTLDVGGYDPKFKIILLAAQAWGTWAAPDAVLNLGIQPLGVHELDLARAQGLRIKLVSSAKRTADGRVQLSVLPAFLRPDDVLFPIREEINAIHIQGQASGPHLFVGRGAGSLPTGTAVLADVRAVQLGQTLQLPAMATTPLDSSANVQLYLRTGQASLVEKLGLEVSAVRDGAYLGTTSIGKLLQHVTEVRASGAFLATVPQGFSLTANSPAVAARA
jgi:homoserine dehydrogenase